MEIGSVSDDLVVLGRDLAPPLEALALFFELRYRGVRLSRDGDALIVGPRNLVTASDGQAIAKWKAPLLTVVERHPIDYEADSGRYDEQTDMLAYAKGLFRHWRRQGRCHYSCPRCRLEEGREQLKWLAWEHGLRAAVYPADPEVP